MFPSIVLERELVNQMVPVSVFVQLRLTLLITCQIWSYAFAYLQTKNNIRFRKIFLHNSLFIIHIFKIILDNPFLYFS